MSVRRRRMAGPFPTKPTASKAAKVRAKLAGLKYLDGAEVTVGGRAVPSKALLEDSRWLDVCAAFHETPPASAAAHNNYGCALAWTGKWQQSKDQLEQAGTGANDNETEVAKANTDVVEAARKIDAER